MSEITEAQRRQPMKEFCGYMSGRIYFEVRNGLFWEVWFSYQDGSSDPNGSYKWKAMSVRYLRRINAMRAANSMWIAFNAGVWCESGRMSCDLIGSQVLFDVESEGCRAEKALGKVEQG